MKKTITLLTLSLSLAATVALACGDEASCSKAGCDKMKHSAASATAVPQNGPGFATLDIKKMECQSCQEKIQSALEKTNGVKKVEFNSKKRFAVVNFDPKVI